MNLPRSNTSSQKTSFYECSEENNNNKKTSHDLNHIQPRWLSSLARYQIQVDCH